MGQSELSIEIITANHNSPGLGAHGGRLLALGSQPLQLVLTGGEVCWEGPGVHLRHLRRGHSVHGLHVQIVQPGVQRVILALYLQFMHSALPFALSLSRFHNIAEV